MTVRLLSDGELRRLEVLQDLDRRHFRFRRRQLAERELRSPKIVGRDLSES